MPDRRARYFLFRMVLSTDYTSVKNLSLVLFSHPVNIVKRFTASNTIQPKEYSMGGDLEDNIHNIDLERRWQPSHRWQLRLGRAQLQQLERCEQQRQHRLLPPDGVKIKKKV